MSQVIIIGIIGIIGITLGLILISDQELEETDYKILPKKWQVSGPFQIDRSEYALGEKIFIVINGLEINDKGEIIIAKQLNATHYSTWGTIPFDGSKKTEFRSYIELKISKYDKVCSIDDIIGKWIMIFNGTNYPDLDFEITEKIVPGTNIEPIC